MSTHSTKLDKVSAKIAFLTNELEVKQLEFQTLSVFLDEAALLSMNLRKRNEEMDSDVHLQGLELIKTEVAAVRNQVASLLSVACSSIK